MELSKVFTSPIVLLGGAAIGVFLLANKGGGGGGGQNVAQYASIVQANNAVAAQAVTKQMEIGANLAAARVDADTTKTLAFYAYLKNQNDNQTVVEKARMETRAGIINSVIVTNAAVTMDVNQQMAKTQQQYLQYDAQKYQADKSVEIAQIQAKVAKNASNNALIGNIFGGIAKVAAAAI